MSATPKNGSFVLSAISTSAMLSSYLTFFEPFEVISNNTAYFHYTYLNYFIISILGFISLSIFLTLFIYIARSWRTISLMLGITLCIWIQTTLLSFDLRSIDGGGITSNFILATISALLWLTIPIACFFFFTKSHQKLFPIVAFLMLVKFFSVSYLCVTTTTSNITHSNYKDNKPLIFGGKGNVVVVVLDTFQSDTFYDIVTESKFEEKELNGYTFFRNNLGAYPSTLPTISAMLSGRTYENQIPLASYVQNSFNGDTLPKYLKQKGFKTSLIWTDSGSINCTPEIADFCWEKGSLLRERVKGANMFVLNVSKILDIIILRTIPSPFRSILSDLSVVSPTYEVLSTFTPIKKDLNFAMPHVQDPILIDLITSNAKVEENSSPLFLFLHLIIPHPSYVYDKDCTFFHKRLPDNNENYQNQAICSLKQITKIQNKLKMLNIYDDTMMVVLSDHGNLYEGKRPTFFEDDENDHAFRGSQSVIEDKVIASALPLLMIKGFKDTGPLKIDDTPVQITDLKQMVLERLEKENYLTSEYTKPQQRPARIFRFYDWIVEGGKLKEGYLPPITNFEVTGHAWKKSSWKKVDRSSP